MAKMPSEKHVSYWWIKLKWLNVREWHMNTTGTPTEKAEHAHLHRELVRITPTSYDNPGYIMVVLDWTRIFPWVLACYECKFLSSILWSSDSNSVYKL